MPFAEIHEDMNLFNCPVTKEMLKVPTSNDVKGVFDFFLKEISNKRPEDMVQAGFGCIDDVDYPELYEDAIPRLHYLRECQEVFRSAQFDEFGIRDVFAPSKSRFNWQISALINFNKFRQNRLSSFEEMAKNADDLLVRERAVIAEKSELQKEITSIEEIRASEKLEADGIREVVSELTQEINALHKQQRALTDQTREAKSELAEKTEKATAVKVRKMTETEDADRMKSRVVSSPDRVRGELDTMRETLQAEREEVDGMEKRTRFLHRRSEGLKKAQSSVKDVITSTEECLVVKERLDRLEHTIQEGQATKSGHEVEAESIKESRGHLERLIDSVGGKVARIDEQRREIDSNTSESDRKLAEQNRQLEAEEEEVSRMIEEKASIARAIQDDIEQSVTDFADKMEKLAEKQELVGERFTAYHGDLTKAAIIVGESSQQSLEDCAKVLRDCENLGK